LQFVDENDGKTPLTRHGVNNENRRLCMFKQRIDHSN